MKIGACSAILALASAAGLTPAGGETVCTGTWTNYPLKPSQNGASCGEAGSTEAKVTIVCGKQ